MPQLAATAFTDEHSGLLWKACPHVCAHTDPKNSPNEWVPQHCYVYPIGVNTIASDHLASKTKTHSCNGACPEAQRLRPATLAEGIRATILWAQTLGRLENESVGNKSVKKWAGAIGTEGTAGGARLKGVWLELWNAAVNYTFPAPLQSPHTDGAIGPIGQVQYPDIPTHLNVSMRPFDLAAARKGKVAIPGGTIPGTQLLLIDPNAVGAVPFTPPQSNSNAPVPTAGPSSVADTPSYSPSDRFFWIQDSGVIEKNSGFFAPKPESLPTRISVIVNPTQLSDLPLTNSSLAQKKTESDIYWTYITLDLSVPRHAAFWQMWQSSNLLHRLYYFDTKESMKFCIVYLNEWVSLLSILSCGTQSHSLLLGNLTINFLAKGSSRSFHSQRRLSPVAARPRESSRMERSSSKPTRYWPGFHSSSFVSPSLTSLF